MEDQAKDPRNVFVVHGRNIKIRDAMFEFLRSLDLFPLDWSELVSRTGKGTPSIEEILDRAFVDAQAVVVLFTPDDEGRLRAIFRKEDDPAYEKETTYQPRLNVVFEAGIAIGRCPKRVIIVEVGKIRSFSDISGLHIVKLDNSIKKRGELARRLQDAHCSTNPFSEKWMEAGNFELNPSPSTRESISLKEPFEKNYKSVAKWFFQLTKRRAYEEDSQIRLGTKNHAYYAISDYCGFLKMDPDEIIEDAKNEVFSSRNLDKHNDYHDAFIKHLMETDIARTRIWNDSNYIRAFYKHNGVPLTTSRITRPKIRKEIRSLATKEIKQIFKNAPIKHGSWILINSYLGLSTEQIRELTVEDFCTQNWSEDEPYPVKIRKSVSKTFAYTTFIGSDAKSVLEQYFAYKKLMPSDRPWNMSPTTLTQMFKKYAYKGKVIKAPNGFTNVGAPKGLFEVTPRSFRYRLHTILEFSDIPPNWIGLLTGRVRYRTSDGRMSTSDSRPTVDQLRRAFLTVLPNLRIFDKTPPTLSDYSE